MQSEKVSYSPSFTWVNHLLTLLASVSVSRPNTIWPRELFFLLISGHFSPSTLHCSLDTTVIYPRLYALVLLNHLFFLLHPLKANWRPLPTSREPQAELLVSFLVLQWYLIHVCIYKYKMSPPHWMVSSRSRDTPYSTHNWNPPQFLKLFDHHKVSGKFAKLRKSGMSVVIQPRFVKQSINHAFN